MTSSFYWPLFEHMTKEHGLTLTESELEEIRLIANTMKRPTDNEMDQAKGEMSEPITISEEARKAAEAELNAAYTRRHIAAHEENEKGFACQLAINSATAPLQKRIEELEARNRMLDKYKTSQIEELEKQLLAMREALSYYANKDAWTSHVTLTLARKELEK